MHTLACLSPMHKHEARPLLAPTYTTRPSLCLPMYASKRSAAVPKASPDRQPVSSDDQHLQLQHLHPVAHQHHNSKQRAYEELDATLDQLGGGKFQLLLLSCICLFWAGDAAEVMVLSYLGPAASCNFGFDSPTSQSLLTSAVFVGMLLGAGSWGFLADELGRKRALVASTAVVVGAGLASAAAPTPTLLLLSRAIVGFGLAGAPVAFTLMMELLPASSRALWGVLIEAAWPVGTVAEAGLAWAVLNTQGWRLLLLLSTLPLAVLLVLIRWLPESPRWLLAQGDTAGTAAVLQQVAKVNSKPVLQLQFLTAAADTLAADTFAAGSSTGAVKSAASAERNQQRPAALRTSSLEDPNLETAALLSDRSSNRSSLSNDLASPQSDIELTVSPTAQRHLASSAGTTQQDPQSQHNTPSLQQQQQEKPAHGQVSLPNRSSSSIQVLVTEVQHAFSMLWGKPYASTTNLLLFSWAAVACAYYGLVQLDGQLHIQAAGSHGGSATACINGRLQVPTSDYAAVVVTAVAEVPAVAWAAAVSKGFGGSTALVSSLVLGSACLLPSIISTALHAGAAHAAGSADTGWSSSLTELSMFGSRLFVSAAFSLLWVFTPSHYPTRARGFGLGVSNSFGRIGGLLSPFIAINFATAASPAAAQAVFAGLCVAAAAAAALTPHGHTTQEQQLEEEEDD